MAGSKVNNYAIGDVNLTSVMSTLDDTRIGYCAVSLTNYATTGVPAIAAGSKVEVDGALFKFDSEEAIGGSPSDGTVYIKLVPAGSSITAEFTNTAPSWSTEKQGWYSPTAGEESYRYLPFGMTKSGSTYSGKYEMITPSVAGVKSFSDGAFSVSGLLYSGSTIAFMANLASTMDYSLGNAQTIIMGSEIIDPVGVYNPSSGLFTAPVAGVYLFFASIFCISAGYTYFTPMASLTAPQIELVISKAPDASGGTRISSASPSFVHGASGPPYAIQYDAGCFAIGVASLAVGDTVGPMLRKVWASSAQVRLRSSSPYCFFGGVKIA